MKWNIESSTSKQRRIYETQYSEHTTKHASWKRDHAKQKVILKHRKWKNPHSNNFFFFSIEAAIYVKQKKDRGQALWKSCTFIIQFILNSKFGLCQASFLAYSNRHSRYGYRPKQACGRIETRMYRGIKIQADLCMGARHCDHLRNTRLWMVFTIKNIASFPHSCSV